MRAMRFKRLQGQARQETSITLPRGSQSRTLRRTSFSQTQESGRLEYELHDDDVEMAVSFHLKFSFRSRLMFHSTYSVLQAGSACCAEQQKIHSHSIRRSRLYHSYFLCIFVDWVEV